MEEDTPFTEQTYCEKKNISYDEAFSSLESFISSKQLKKRYIKTIGFLYWNDSIIYSDSSGSSSVNSHPYENFLSHVTSPDSLSDEQLNQERIWLKQQYRQTSKLFEELNHLSKSHYDENNEKHLEELITKWIDVNQQILSDIQYQLKIRGKYLSMNALIQELGIQSMTQIKWNPQTQEFQEY